MTDTLVLPPNTGVGFSSQVDTQARVKKAQFGNGYAQRSGDGLNAIVDTFTLSMTNLRAAEVDQIDAFFRAQAGYKAFYWTKPRATSPQLFTCEKWSRSYTDAMVDGITATFQEVFTPGGP